MFLFIFCFYGTSSRRHQFTGEQNNTEETIWGTSETFYKNWQNPLTISGSAKMVHILNPDTKSQSPALLSRKWRLLFRPAHVHCSFFCDNAKGFCPNYLGSQSISSCINYKQYWMSTHGTDSIVSESVCKNCVQDITLQKDLFGPARGTCTLWSYPPFISIWLCFS